jgi:hypothetical protein
MIQSNEFIHLNVCLRLLEGFFESGNGFQAALLPSIAH